MRLTIRFVERQARVGDYGLPDFRLRVGWQASVARQRREGWIE
jgi:hypothetical protein